MILLLCIVMLWMSEAVTEHRYRRWPRVNEINTQMFLNKFNERKYNEPVYRMYLQKPQMPRKINVFDSLDKNFDKHEIVTTRPLSMEFLNAELKPLSNVINTDNDFVNFIIQHDDANNDINGVNNDETVKQNVVEEMEENSDMFDFWWLV
ncbi:uncharacterized protein LOC125239202 [Leguminivora glycinivorella]|uniref:uncharacterized protein LOC125239202 n=1 Tax=Leguminivora glycinivorella TaxID=1035111 RepID=UPI00200CB98D|nr:uncharacterized protein LOC125239202 [Leguminivora glycinivorella]